MDNEKISFNTENDINVKISKKDGGTLFDENCCTCINILLTNDGKIATSFLGCHNPFIVMQLERAQKVYFKELKKALKRDFKEYGILPDDDECGCENHENHEHCHGHHEGHEHHCGCGCEEEGFDDCDCNCEDDCDCGCHEGEHCTCEDEKPKKEIKKSECKTTKSNKKEKSGDCCKVVNGKTVCGGSKKTKK